MFLHNFKILCTYRFLEIGTSSQDVSTLIREGSFQLFLIHTMIIQLFSFFNSSIQIYILSYRDKPHCSTLTQYRLSALPRLNSPNTFACQSQMCLRCQESSRYWSLSKCARFTTPTTEMSMTFQKHSEKHTSA